MSDNSNRRKHLRMSIVLDVELNHPELGSEACKTKDLSDGGLFIKTEQADTLTVGQEVAVRLKATLGDGKNAPQVPMIVRRVTEDGIGLEFSDRNEELDEPSVH